MQPTCTVTNTAMELLTSMQPALHITYTREKKNSPRCYVPYHKRRIATYSYISGVGELRPAKHYPAHGITHTADNTLKVKIKGKVVPMLH
jgi:hypothetical protein